MKCYTEMSETVERNAINTIFQYERVHLVEPQQRNVTTSRMPNRDMRDSLNYRRELMLLVIITHKHNQRIIFDKSALAYAQTSVGRLRSATCSRSRSRPRFPRRDSRCDFADCFPPSPRAGASCVLSLDLPPSFKPMMYQRIDEASSSKICQQRCNLLSRRVVPLSD